MAASVERSDDEEGAVSLGQQLGRSARFKALFAEGMALVEEAASYLDGPGRTEALLLRPGLRSAYAAEGMRLTTRLMQIASWLLLRRAVVDGQVASEVVAKDRVRVSLSAQHLVSSPAVFAQLPAALQDLATRSLGLQKRILHLDRMVGARSAGDPPEAGLNELDRRIALLRSAFEPTV